LATAGLGEPGENGEWISLSNKCIPPLGSPSTLKVGRLGVGNGPSAMLGLRPVMENDVLRGVPIEASEPSGLDTDMLRCLRLNDDLFFLTASVELFPPIGEPGARPGSLAMFRAGVSGDTVSAGL
jgi:hypothetical protein